MIEGHDSTPLRELGVPPYDVVTARSDEHSISYLFDGDAKEVLGELA